MTTVQEQTHEHIRGFRQYLHRETGERVWSVSGALRVHLNNFSVYVLKDYIALSRHQFELIEFVTQRTGIDTGEPLKFEVMNWSKGKPDIWIDRGKPRTDEIPQWELQMLEDMAWRAQAMGRALSKFESNMTINSTEDLMELSRHQCEMLNFLKTGSFRKVPGRRKARTISNSGSTPDSAERIKFLGEALREYQGRIEIRTVREFIALSKHQCELAGLLFQEAESGQPVFEVVHYRDAYPDAAGSSGCSAGSGLKLVTSRSRPEPHISDRQVAQGTEPPAHHQRFLDNEISGSSRPVPGYKLEPAKNEERSEDGPCGKNMPFEAFPLDPDIQYDLPRVPMLPGGNIPLPADGRWVRVDTPDGPMAMRSTNPEWPPPEPVWYDDVWDDDHWDEGWDDDP